MVKEKLPLGVTGNTPDSGSGESWFEPRRGNGRCESTGLFLVSLLLGSLGMSHLSQDSLKARMATQRGKIRVEFDPLPVPEAVFYGFLQKIKRLIGLSK